MSVFLSPCHLEVTLMKKRITIICVLLVCFLILSNLLDRKTNVIIGKSTKFTQEEVQEAISCVIENFEEKFPGCYLKKLWYEEEKSNAEIVSYMIWGKGSRNGVEKENVIVLFSNFYVNKSGGRYGSLNPNSYYKDFNWILIRDSKTGNWKIDDSGY